jgi:hypothetical protein
VEARNGFSLVESNSYDFRPKSNKTATIIKVRNWDSAEINHIPGMSWFGIPKKWQSNYLRNWEQTKEYVPLLTPLFLYQVWQALSRLKSSVLVQL